MSWHSALLEQLGIVEHYEHGLGHARDRRDQPDDIGDADSSSRDRAEHFRLDALHPIDATARYAKRTAGSLSRSSTDSHATRLDLSLASSASNVVLPYPAGATTAISGTRIGPRQRIEERRLVTTPGRACGANSLDGSRSKPTRDESVRLRARRG